MKKIFTQGNWEITDDCQFRNKSGSIPIGVKNNNAPLDRSWIAEAKSSHVNIGMPHDEWLANAKLIAMSPKLFDAVVKCQEVLAKYIVPDSKISDKDCITELLGILDDRTFVGELFSINSFSDATTDAKTGINTVLSVAFWCEGCEEKVSKTNTCFGYKLCDECNDKYNNETGYCSLHCCLGGGCDGSC